MGLELFTALFSTIEITDELSNLNLEYLSNPRLFSKYSWIFTRTGS